jgi:membrane protein DedA with SNARE-associated domain
MGFIPTEIWTYIVLYFSTIILGNAVAFSAFVVAFLGGLGPWGMLGVTVTVTLADLSGDSLWFILGKKLCGTKIGNFIKSHLPHHDLIAKHIHEDSLKWLYLSKFLSSVTAPFLFLLGWSQNVSMRKFFEANVKTTIFWIAILLVGSSIIGSGLLPFVSADFFKKIEFTVTVVVVSIFIFQFLVKYLSKKPLIKNFLKKISGLNGTSEPKP